LLSFQWSTNLVEQNSGDIAAINKILTDLNNILFGNTDGDKIKHSGIVAGLQKADADEIETREDAVANLKSSIKWFTDCNLMMV
jgi:hypothetical protein